MTLDYISDRIDRGQFCGYCPEDKCLLDCKICNPKFGKGCKCDC